MYFVVTYCITTYDVLNNKLVHNRDNELTSEVHVVTRSQERQQHQPLAVIAMLMLTQ